MNLQHKKPLPILPICQTYVPDMKDPIAKIGELRVVPAGTLVWSISLQETVKFNRDQIIKVTHRIHFDHKGFFGTIQNVYTGHHLLETGYDDKHNGELGPMSTDDVPLQKIN